MKSREERLAVRAAWRERNRERINAKDRAYYRARQERQGVKPMAARRAEAIASAERLTDAQSAYLAALLDGEGCVVVGRDKPRGAVNWRYRVNVRWSMTTTEPLNTVATWLGAKVRTTKTRTTAGNLVYTLSLSEWISIAALKMMLPFLILKRDQAELAIELSELKEHTYGGQFLSPEIVERREEVWNRLAALKSKKGWNAERSPS